MTGMQAVMQTMEQFSENELIFSKRLYMTQFNEVISDEAYYQALGRMCKAGTLCRIAKGIYYRPKISKYGVVPPSQNEIVVTFTEPDKGTIVGYSLYNSLKLTTQVAKTIEVLSSAIDQQTKKIGNVFLQSCDLVYTPKVKNMIHMLDVLQNFDKIQDLNFHQFLYFCEKFSQEYDDNTFEQVIKKMKYQKKTISFLRTILNYYSVEHKLNGYLSTLSEYKHPTMEELYEAAYLS